MPRKPRKLLKMRKNSLSPKLRAFFERGALTIPDLADEEDADIFVTVCSYKKTAEAYKPHREEILADWKKQKRPGLPFVEKFIRRGGICLK